MNLKSNKNYAMVAVDVIMYKTIVRNLCNKQINPK